jgi:ERCC4-type nuclease
MTPEETARLIVYAACQVQSLGKAGYARPGYRPKTKKGRQLHILQGLPGVGPDRALRLLEKFGSVEAVMRAGLEDLMAIEGIGAKTADRIRWAVCEKLEPYGDEPEQSIWPL